MPVPVLAMELARDRLPPTEFVHATLESWRRWATTFARCSRRP